MSNSTITCVYKVTAMGAQSVSSLASRMAAVPVDLTIPKLNGLRYSADTISTSGPVVTRSIEFKMGPITPAAGSTTLDAGNRGSPVATFVVDDPGSGNASPPIIQVVGNSNVEATARCLMGLSGAAVIKPGVGYVNGSSIVFSGGGVGVTQATAHVVTVIGSIASVVIDTPGSGYTQPPDYLINGVGSGAVLSFGLLLLQIIPVAFGMGYETAPSLTFTPEFLARCPDTSSQGSCLENFMTSIFEGYLQTDVNALLPAVS